MSFSYGCQIKHFLQPSTLERQGEVYTLYMEREREREREIRHGEMTSQEITILHTRLIKTRDPNSLRDILFLLFPSPSSSLLSYVRQIFLDHAPTAHPFPWNTIIRAHSLSSSASPHAFSLFSSMRRHGPSPDFHTFPFLLRACSLHPSPLSSLLFGQSTHAVALKLNLLSLHSSNALVSFYGRHSLSNLAVLAFHEISPQDRDLVSWSALVSAMACSGRNTRALEIFRLMQASGETPDEIVMATAAWASTSPETATWIYCYVRRRRLRLTAALGTALVAALARSGRIAAALKVFDEMPDRNLLARTALVSSLAAHGMGNRAVEIFGEIRSDGETPDHVAFIGALMACSHAGLVDEGLRLFESMKRDYGLEPMMEHYGCVVDLMGRAGLVYEAREFISRMPVRPGPVVWRILLGASVAHGYVDLAEHVRSLLADLDPDHDGDDVLLSNAYAGIGRWGDKAAVRAQMATRGVIKCPGRSTC